MTPRSTNYRLLTFQFKLFTLPRGEIGSDIILQVLESKFENSLSAEKDHYVNTSKTRFDINFYNAVERIDLLQLAIVHGDAELALMILKRKKFDFNQVGSNKDAALHVAVACNNIDLVRLLLRTGASVNLPG